MLNPGNYSGIISAQSAVTFAGNFGGLHWRGKKMPPDVTDEVARMTEEAKINNSPFFFAMMTMAKVKWRKIKMQAIHTMGLIKQYKDLVAVDRLNLEILQGELFSLLGVNGAGKTTAIRMLSCLTKPTGGDALVGGCSVTKEPERVKRLIGVSPQETAVAPNLTVRENLELICGIHSFSKEKTAQKIKELSGQLGLDTVLHRKAGKLSGGWQRRVSIAMALISEPRILFLDEPTLGLDVIARHDLWEVIRSLKGRITVVLTTHYMEEAQTLSDRIGIMKDGHLLAVGTVEELMDRAGARDFETAFVSIVKEAQA